MKTTSTFWARISTLVVVLSLGSVGVINSPAPALANSSHRSMARLRQGTSSNWSGYAAYGANGSFNSVSASWVQPAVSCTSTNTYSSFWVGLDGYNNSTVEQLGTEADCSSGSPSYYAWYEMYPHPGFYVDTVAVHVGDHLSASVVASVSGRYTLSINNLTTGKHFSTAQKANSAKRASAEVVVEAPWNGGTLSLANFGTASFTSALANNQPLGGFANLDPITMLNPYGMKATPSVFDTTKQNFSVTWSAN